MVLVESPLLEILKTQLDKVLSNLPRLTLPTSIILWF